MDGVAERRMDSDVERRKRQRHDCVYRHGECRRGAERIDHGWRPDVFDFAVGSSVQLFDQSDVERHIRCFGYFG